MNSNWKVISLEDAMHCARCQTKAAHVEPLEGRQKEYSRGEVVLIACPSKHCKEKPWFYCKTCRIRQSRRCLARHATRRKHKDNHAKLHPITNQDTTENACMNVVANCNSSTPPLPAPLPSTENTPNSAMEATDDTIVSDPLHCGNAQVKQENESEPENVSETMNNNYEKHFRIQQIVNYLAKDLIGNNPNPTTIREYAQKLYHEGFESVELIQTHLQPEDIQNWKPLHQRVALPKLSKADRLYF